jgi:tetratricopeptide (TPR) repeat protein
LLLVATALAGAAWVRSRQSDRERAAGLWIAHEVAALSRRGRELGSAGRQDEAVQLLDRAVGLLRGAQGARGAPFASLLVDLVSLRLARQPQDPATRTSARALLEEARSINGLPVELRARIDRDLGCVCLLDGDLRAAEARYTDALRLNPSDREAGQRLLLLRNTQTAQVADAR